MTKLFKQFQLGIILFLMSSHPAWVFAGQTHVFEKEGFQKSPYFTYDIKRFETDDEVILTQNGTPAERFKLADYLGGGSGGRVFRLADSNPPQVIKFRYGGMTDYQLMSEELKAFSYLKAEGIPHSQLISSDMKFYMIKEFIPGSTLDEVAFQQWELFESGVQEKMILKLKDIYDRLKRSRYTFTDLRGPNLIFDRDTLEWKVIDAGPIIQHTIHQHLFSRNSMLDEFGLPDPTNIADWFQGAPNERLDSFQSIRDTINCNPEMKAVFDSRS